MNPRFKILRSLPALATLVGGALLVASCSSRTADAPKERVGSASQNLFLNGGFEADAIGTRPPSSWTEATYINPGITDLRPAQQTQASLNLTAGGVARTETVGNAVTMSGVDPDVPLNYPFVGLRAGRVNSLGARNDGINQNVNSIDQTMTVSVNDVDPIDGNVHIRMVVAPVLENPGHTYVQQPYYYVELKNVTRGTTLYQDFNASNQSGVTWLTATDRNGNAADYTDWALIDISPGSAALAIGDVVDLTIFASGCSLGAHWGRVYVDGLGPTIPALNVEATGPASANRGANFTYTFTYTNGSGSTTSGTTFTFVTPPSTTFQSASLGTCSGLAANGTGTETCTLGTLAPGATGTFTITVRIPNGTAVGTVITNGAYQISATGVSPLVGNKVNTTVTTGATFADLSITKNDGVTAVVAGGTLTYTIVASNAGPSAVTGATVTDTPPASLTNVAWTCAASAGSSCTASGTNTISDGAVNLLVGGTATYTMTAKVALAATGTIINNATISVPAAITDPVPTNNSAGDTDTIGTADTLTVTKNGAQGGTITSTPAAISCGTGCTSASGAFLDGSTVVLNATAAPGWTFVGWTGACTGSGPSCSFTVSGTPNVSAKFTGPPSSVAVSAGGTQSTNVSTAFGTPLSVLVTDVLGDPLSGVTVTYTVPGAGASAVLSSATAITDASGIASVTATANATAGSYSVTAAVAGVASPATFALTNLGVPASVTVISGTPQTAAVGTAFAAALLVEVRDSLSHVIPGVTVSFAGPGSGASANLSAASAITGANGRASVTATANTVAGGYTVNATVGGVAAPGAFALTNTAGGAAAIVASGGTPQSATVGTAFAAALRVTVEDSFGNPVSGATVTFTPPGSGASAALGAAATTDAAGHTQVSATANTVAGTYAVSATVAGASTPASFALTNLAGAPAAIVASSGSGQTASVGAAFGAPLVVTVVDAFGNPVPGVTVVFTDPASGASAGLGAPGATNASGQTSVTATANGVTGTYTVTATVGGLSATFSLTNSAGAPATIAVSSGSGQSARVGTAFGAALVAVVKDSFGNPVPGASVTFAAPGSGASAGLSGSPATTNASGLASALATANAVAGAYAVTASVVGAAAPASFALTNTAGAAATVTVSSGSGQTTAVGTAFGAPLVAVVKDSNGNVVPGAAVTFTPPGSGASAGIAGSPATTSAAGLATVTATANTVAGSYSVTASTPGATSATFALTNTAGAPATIAVSSGSGQSATVGTGFAAPLVAVVKDASGNPVSGVAVTFTPPGSGASAAIVGSPATTNASGLASVTATAGTVAGAYAVSAAATGVAAPASFSLKNTPGAAATVTVSSGSGQSTTVGTPFGGSLVAVVKDSNGNVVPGVVVTFTSPGSGASAVVLGSPATTGAAGLATVTATANATAGSYTVTASAPGATSASFSLTNTAGPAAAITVSSGSGQSATVGTGFGLPLVALVRDGSGNPVAGVSVTFTPPGSGASAAIGGSPATTNASGFATVTAVANTVAGTYGVSAAATGVAAPASFSLTNTAGAAATIAVSSGSGQSTAVGTAFASSLVAVVKDASGNPVSGVPVTFTPPGAGASAAIAGSPATTNGSGLATVTATANATPGAYAVSASATGVAAPASFSLTNTAGAASTITVVSGTGQSAVVGAAFAAPLVAVVKDSGGNPVSGVLVTFAPPGAGASAAVAGSPATSDASGLVSVTVTANAVAGGYAVTASASGVASPASFSLTNTAGAPATITVSSGSGQSTAVGTAFGAPLAAVVKDASGNPVPNATVTFAPPAAGASATVSGSPATTDASGIASVTATANTVAGAYAVTASVSGAAAPASFSLTNTAGAPASIAVASGSGQSAAVTTAFGAPLVALVTDASGNPVPGVAVTFAPPGSGASATVSGSPATTSAAGLASVTATANAVAGAYTVSATAAGIASPASFSLTNTAGQATQITVVSGSGQQTTVAQPFAAPLVALVTDAANNPVAGAQVALTAPSSGPSASLSATLAVSDSAGHVSVTAVSGTAAGAFNVNATLQGVAAPATFALRSVAGAAVAIVAAPGSTPQTAAESTPFPVPLGVIVVDAYGNPVSGVTVTFAAPGSAPSASLGSTTGVTNASGVTSVAATAGATPGVYVVTATLPNGTEVNFTLTNVATPPNTITVSSGAPASVVVGTALAAPLVALVKDGSGSPLPSAVVTFTDPPTGATTQLAAASAVTSASGLAQVTGTASNRTGAYAVVATVAGAASPALFDITNTPGPAASIVAAPSSTPQSTQVGTAFAAPLVVTVLDAFGNPIPGATVLFTVPASGASATLGAVPVTDASGQVSVPATANGTTGSYAIIATVAGVSAPATFQLTNLATAPNTIQVKSGSAQATVVATPFAAPLVALVLDPKGNPVPNVTVTFAPPASAPNAALGAPTATTDASGLAQTTATASNLAGQYAVIATIVGGATPAVFALTNTPGAPTTVTASASSTPQSAQVGTVYAQPLIVTVTDAFGNGVPGVSVQYVAPSTGASVSLAATLPTTSSNGQTSVVAIANATAGSFDVTATVTGIAAPATFVLTNTASGPSSLVVTSGGGQSTEATTAFPAPVVLSAHDSLGNAVAGAAITVTLPTTGPSATFSPTTPTTDATGSVSIQLTANAHVGTFGASFSVAGASSPASVNLTNTAIPTTTVLTASTTTPVEGASITLTAVVSSLLGTPTGTVAFFAGGTPLGQATVTAGTAILVVPAPAAGAYSVTAVYGAQDPYAASTSNAIAMTVSGASDAGAPDGGVDGSVDGGAPDAEVDAAGGEDGAVEDAGGEPDSGAADGAAATDSGGGEADAGADATVTGDGGGGSGSPGGSIQGGGCTCTSAAQSSEAPAGTGILAGLALAAVLGRTSRVRRRRSARG